MFFLIIITQVLLPETALGEAVYVGRQIQKATISITICIPVTQLTRRSKEIRSFRNTFAFLVIILLK